MQNDILGPVAQASEVADRIAARSRERRAPGYSGEVRALMTAALAVMSRCGTSSTPRVADIVAEAGLSNDAFYRHFSSKDALVTALLEDGIGKLRGYLVHVLAKETDPAAQVRRWVEGVLSQTDPSIAATTLAVLANGGTVGRAAGRHVASAPLGTLLREPFAALGSRAPDLGAAMAAHAVLGCLSDHLWQGTQPSEADLEAMTRFCVAAASA